MNTMGMLFVARKSARVVGAVSPTRTAGFSRTNSAASASSPSSAPFLDTTVIVRPSSYPSPASPDRNASSRAGYARVMRTATSGPFGSWLQPIIGTISGRMRVVAIAMPTTQRAVSEGRVSST